MNAPSRNPWTEFAIQSVPQAFPGWYDRLAGQLLAPVHEELARRAAARHPGRVLDHGTGSARLAIAVARRCPDARVKATDVSDHLRMLAEERVRAAGLEHRIQLGLIENDRWPFADRVHDVALAAFVLHCQADLPTRLFPHLRAGGRLILAELNGDVPWPLPELAAALTRRELAPRWLPRRLLESVLRRAHAQFPARETMETAVRESPFGCIHDAATLDLTVGDLRIPEAVLVLELHSPEVVSQPE